MSICKDISQFAYIITLVTSVSGNSDTEKADSTAKDTEDETETDGESGMNNMLLCAYLQKIHNYFFPEQILFKVGTVDGFIFVGTNFH